MAKAPKKRTKKYNPNKYTRPGNEMLGLPSSMFKMPDHLYIRIHLIPLTALFCLQRCIGDLWHIQAVEFRIRLIPHLAKFYLEEPLLVEVYKRAKSVIDVVIERFESINQWRLLNTEHRVLSEALGLADRLHLDSARPAVHQAYMDIQREIQKAEQTVYKVKE